MTHCHKKILNGLMLNDIIFILMILSAAIIQLRQSSDLSITIVLFIDYLF